ncbi:hypothetical protein HHI36_023071 [Cryptolaemus montrouzieri]|uniref:Uncharacterized protein n=1 Tax=Cryptolaemus montrouzieri TaxID=559131 RepID=A0ABD2PF78_9CUCU
MEKNNGELEEILVQVTSTSQVYYTDSQDCQHTDDFEVTVVVHNLCFPYSPNDNVLHLKYYLILTSKSELYPASGKEEKLGKFKTVSSASRSILGTLDSQEFPANNVAPERIIKTEQTEEVSSITDTDQIESVIENDEKDINHVGISTEEVNYLGYYSSHEQLMHQLILEKAKATQRHITSMVTKGMVHCRTSLLWNKLVSHDFVLTYNEFIELKSLANLELLSNIHPNLGPLLNQPVSWYEGLAKLLLLKYSEYKRSFISPDGNIQHYVMLHTSYDGAFMLLSIDLHMARGDLYAVYREIGRYEDVDVCHAYQKQLLDGFVNCIAFYLWSGMV